MFTLTKLMLIAILSATISKASSVPAFKASYGSSPRPFEIDVDAGFVALTKLKASLTRYTVDINVADFFEGPPQHNVSTLRDYWANEYEWVEVQAKLNTKFRQFTTTVSAIGPRSNFSDPVPLHFVHHRSRRADAIPLLFIQ
jgi:hypothetical protein